MRLNRIVVAIILLMGACTLALAGTASANLSVTASISANCTIGASAVAFGPYDPIGANKSADLAGTGTVTTTCTNEAAVKITLSQGSHADTGSSDTTPLRRMIDTGNTRYLSYFLYQDSGHSTVWGNTAGTGKDDTGDGTAKALTVYGVIPKNQNLPASSYTDTVVATVTF